MIESDTRYTPYAPPQYSPPVPVWSGTVNNGANPWGPGPALVSPPVTSPSKGGKLVLAIVVLLVVAVVAIGIAVNYKNTSDISPSNPVSTAPVGDNDVDTLQIDVMDRYNEDGADLTDVTCIEKQPHVFTCLFTGSDGDQSSHEVTVNADGTNWIASAAQ